MCRRNDLQWVLPPARGDRLDLPTRFRKIRTMRQYLDLMERDPRRRRREARPHRHRHALGLRPSDALRSRREGFPLRHDQEAASQVDHLRAALVPAPATPTSNISTTTASRIWNEWADERGELGPVYGRQWRSWPTPDGGTIDQIAEVVHADPPQSRFPPADRHRLEPGRHRQDGAAAVPLPVPVLRRGRRAVLPALSALGRRLPRRAVQHRLLRAADVDGGAGDRAQARRVRPHARRRASLPQSSRAGAAAALARAAPAAAHAAQSGGDRSFAFRYEDFTLEGYDPHPHIKAEVAV